MGLFDWKMITRIHPTITWLMACLMILSLLAISAHSIDPSRIGEEAAILTSQALAQAKWFGLCWIVYFLVAAFDYHKLREWTWPVYGVCLFMLVGVFFTEPIANVHRWYRLPFIGMSLQPSQCAQLAMIMALSWQLEKAQSETGNKGSFLKTLPILLIAFIPFLLILKQPDLGSALVIYPVLTGMLFVSGHSPLLLRLMLYSAAFGLCAVLLIFLGIVSHEALRPFALQVLHEYQYERLNPGGYHNIAGQIAIALGGFWGSGWRQGAYASQGWLPEAYTDSIFAAFGEQFGLVGNAAVMAIYTMLAWHGFRVAASTKDHFGQLLSTGLSLYLAVHVMINMAMMLGVIPITGVALPIMSYGGSSSLSAVVVLGILQSIWARRFMF